MSTSRESDKFMLRLPNGMRERVRVASELNKRSMNAEIVARLESSFAMAAMRDALDPDAPTEAQEIAIQNDMESLVLLLAETISRKRKRTDLED